MTPSVRHTIQLDHKSKPFLHHNHSLKSQHSYRYKPMIFNINIFNIYTLISPVNVSNIGHIRNIGSDIGQYYRVNIVSDTSKSDIILPIYI